ncbi:CAP domain-containing protein [Tunturibacter empetritectus]|uniref:CAP domain-containing protein n=1 Tax=Tunturiibacter empetritectus TaxID=3069691 RepID=A0AAU7ZF19_9BACT
MSAPFAACAKSLISLQNSRLGHLALAALLLPAAHLLPAQSFESSANLTVAEQYLLAAANQDRINQGLQPLRFDPVLAEASEVHAREMADHAEISHQFDGEPELAARGANAGAHFSLITENVAEAPTSVIIHNLWMHSPGHRANLLDPNVDSIGIAIVTRNHQLYAVEDFASTVQTLSLNQQERTVAGVIAQSGMRVAETTVEARQTCTMSSGYAGSRQPWYIMRYTAGSLNEIPSQLRSKLASGKYHQAVVGACSVTRNSPFTAYNIAVLLYP